MVKLINTLTKHVAKIDLTTCTLDAVHKGKTRIPHRYGSNFNKRFLFPGLERAIQ